MGRTTSACGTPDDSPLDARAPRPPGGELLPRGRPEAPSAALLLPFPIGAIPADGEMPETFYWHQAAGRAAEQARPGGSLTQGAEVLRPTRGVGAILPESDPPSGCARMSLPAVLRAIGALGSTEKDAPPASGEKEPVGGIIDPWTRFEYGDISFTLPTAWLASYVAEGRASSAEDALDVLWFRYLSRETPSSDTVRGLLHCWNVPEHPRNHVVWNAFWADGGPINVFEHMLRLVFAFREYARDDVSGTDWCDGLDEFIGDALRRLPARTRDERFCPEGGVRFFVRSVDERFAEDWSQRCVSGAEAASCGAGSVDSRTAEVCGEAADAWSLGWSAEGPNWVFHQWRFGLRGLFPRSMAENGCGSTARGEDLSVEFLGGAIRFGSEGFLVDWLLWWARAALDYWSENPLPRPAYLDSASRVARFALRRVASLSELVIHELGHVYIDAGGHCSRGCCMNIAAAGWGCKVTAWLGLPVGEAYPTYGGASSLSLPCDDGDYSSNCSISEVGTVGGSWTFDAEGSGC